MPLDPTGATLGLLIATALGEPDPPVNPTPAQLASYLIAKQAQITNWTTISQQIIQYMIANTVVSTTVTTSVNTTDTVPALGLVSPGGLTPAPVTGVAAGTGSGTGNGTGTGTIS